MAGGGLSPLTQAQRKAAERARKRRAGFRAYELWLSRSELKGVRSLLKRLRGKKPVATSPWRPIETAPQSKSCTGRDRHYVLVAYPGWKDGKPNPIVLMAYQDSLGWDTGTWRLHEHPTHWMPMPSLPDSRESSLKID